MVRCSQMSWPGLGCALAAMGLLVAAASAMPADLAVEPEQVMGHFVGMIGGNLAVQLDLQVESREISGWYYYESVGTRLELKGSINPGRPDVALDEFEESAPRSDAAGPGRKTGRFTGTLDPNSGDFAGQWTSPDGKRSLPFRLAKVADYRQLKTYESGVVDAATVFPRLSGPPALADLSKAVQDQARKGQMEFVADARGDKDDPVLKHFPTGEYILFDTIAMHYWSAGLVSMLDTGYEYTGGAHGNTGFAAKNYMVRGNKAVRFGLEDLFRKKSDYVKAISDICITELRKQKASSVLDGHVTAFEAEDLSAFTVDPRNITIHFAPYHVGCYAEGTFEVKVPLRELEKLIDLSGPMKNWKK